MSRSRFPSQNVEIGEPVNAPASCPAMSASDKPSRVATSGPNAEAERELFVVPIGVHVRASWRALEDSSDAVA